MSHAKRSRRRSRGAAMIEYVLLLSLFTLVAIPGVSKLRDGTEDQTKETSSKIGGATVGTTPPPTTRVPPTTTTAPPPTTTVAALRPQIDAGPDQRVAPGQAFTQAGSYKGPGNPIYPGGDYWVIDNTAPSSAVTNPMVGTTEDYTSSMTWVLTKPGYYNVTHGASNPGGWVQDNALIKVTSGAINNPFTLLAVYPGRTNPATTWDVHFGTGVTNTYGQPAPDITVTVRLTLTDGTTRDGSCVSEANGWCAAWITLPHALTPTSGVITGMSGACLDSYTIPPPMTWGGTVTPWPTTTTTSTTSTTTTSTSTTSVPPTSTSTTLPITTTTKKKPNG